MIIVEGMDNSGKSTLVKTLMSWNPQLNLVASEGPKDHDAMFLRCSKGMVDPCSIFDRYHLFSEWVYGPVLRGSCKLEESEWTELAYLTMLNAPIVIYCRPEDDVIAQFDQRDQMAGVKENTKVLLERYDRVMEYFRRLTLMYHTGAVFRYDYREMELVSINDFIKDYIGSRLELHHQMKAFADQFINPTPGRPA